ncbi:MAG: AzlC family ABC transporter permease [Lachnospiraceae bacterium]|nr:AzlC family ABC transporter permease [Lachnospiraceae bacterium]
MKKKIKYAFPKTLPVMCGYIFLGIAWGIVLAEAGYNFIWAFFISCFVYAGSMQFTMVPLMVSAVSPVTMAVTTLFVNSRHLFYGLSFVESFKKIKQMPYMIFGLTDETYSVLCGCKNEDPDEKNREAWFWITILDQSYWVIGSVLGALLGEFLPFDFTGIDFAMTALFVVILIEQMLSNPKKNVAVAVFGMLSAVICLFVFGVEKFLLPSLLITVTFVFVFSLFYKEKGGSKNAV